LYAYKLKKPILYHGIDFRTLALRERNCREELRLNRRLAAAVYIDVVPLALGPEGLVLEADGPLVEWLVKMHRLPRKRMLDRLARGPVDPALLEALVARLAAYYARAARPSWTGAEYRAHLAAQIADWRQEVQASGRGSSTAAVVTLAAALQSFLAAHAGWLDARIAAGRVVDAHGDLRPEHICLGPEPAIIDCLEFSAELRLLDSAEELAFLDLECEWLGRPDLGRDLFERYRRHGDDDLPLELYGFYRGRRALARALVCAWRLAEPLPGKLGRLWTARRDWYLAAGLRSLST
jgi:aminoglycoside phosphotransferase family enzyme